MAREPFQYAVIRVVPQIERDEFVNVGVIVFCRTRGFLGARVGFEPGRVRLLAPGIDLSAVPDYLDGIVRIAAGDPEAGPIAALPPSERFGWLAAPSSTVVQTSPIHTGLSDDPERTLDHLFERLVAVCGSTRARLVVADACAAGGRRRVRGWWSPTHATTPVDRLHAGACKRSTASRRSAHDLLALAAEPGRSSALESRLYAEPSMARRPWAQPSTVHADHLRS